MVTSLAKKYALINVGDILETLETLNEDDFSGDEYIPQAEEEEEEEDDLDEEEEPMSKVQVKMENDDDSENDDSDDDEDGDFDPGKTSKKRKGSVGRPRKNAKAPFLRQKRTYTKSGKPRK